VVACVAGKTAGSAHATPRPHHQRVMRGHLLVCMNIFLTARNETSQFALRLPSSVSIHSDDDSFILRLYATG
jgi:hypothetical protein